MNDKRFKQVERSANNEVLCIENKVRAHERDGVIYFDV